MLRNKKLKIVKQQKKILQRIKKIKIKIILKSIIRNQLTKLSTRALCLLYLKKCSKKYTNSFRSVCIITGRPKYNIKPFAVSRYQLNSMASTGELINFKINDW